MLSKLLRLSSLVPCRHSLVSRLCTFTPLGFKYQMLVSVMCKRVCTRLSTYAFVVSNIPSLVSRLSSLVLIALCALPAFAADDYFFKANELYDQGKFKEAVPLYRAAIDDGRYEPFAWFNLGNALVQLDRKQVAMVAYKRTVELLPTFEKAWMLLGDLYYLGEDYGEAIASYNRAIELGVESDHIHFDRIMISYHGIFLLVRY